MKESRYDTYGIGDAYSGIPATGGNYAKAVAACMHSHDCRKTRKGVICPSFRFTGYFGDTPETRVVAFRGWRWTCACPARQGKFSSWVEEGADLARDGVVRFRRVELRDRIAAELGVKLHERSVGRCPLNWLPRPPVSRTRPRGELSRSDLVLRTAPDVLDF